jgi:hypothetical protein
MGLVNHPCQGILPWNQGQGSQGITMVATGLLHYLTGMEGIPPIPNRWINRIEMMMSDCCHHLIQAHGVVGQGTTVIGEPNPA